MEEDYLFPFEDDENNEVVFDQPYFYEMRPEGGKYDELDFYNFPNGCESTLHTSAFITSDGYFFNNLGFDRYGGRLDDNGDYFRVRPSEIKNKEKVEPAPAYEPGTKEETSYVDAAYKGIDDGFVGEEDYGDDEIFGSRKAAPQYCKDDV